MRFMVIVKASETSEAGAMPTQAQLAELGRYDENLARAGVLLAGEGLHPSSGGARVRFGDAGARTVIAGPFARAGELVAGYWLLQTRTRGECVEWVKRIPFREGEVEIRQVLEPEDLGEASAPELRERRDRLRAQVGRRHG